MSFSLASLIAIAVMAMVRAASFVAPPPLAHMAHALHHVHGYRMTTITVSSTAGQPGSMTTHTDTIFVRHGAAADTYTVSTSTAQGKTLRAESVAGDTRNCFRQSGQKAWQCQPASGTAGAGLLDTSMADAIAGLATELRWTETSHALYGGLPCRVYHAASLPGAQQRIRLTLWIAQATMLPVALHATTSFGGGSSTTLSEQTTWSNWNDPRLTVPVVK